MRRLALKILRDLSASRGRVLLMVLALAAGLTSLGTVLSVRAVLQREMTRNYLGTAPASATFDIGHAPLPEGLLDDLRARPDVAAAELRAMTAARWQTEGGPLRRGLLSVMPSVTGASLARVFPQAGTVEPGRGEVLIERDAARFTGLSPGQTVSIQVGGGPPVDLRIAGVVHDPALPPAASEQAGYFYLTPATFAQLTESGILDELRILVADDPLSATAVEAQVVAVAGWLAAQGVPIHEVRVPPPGEHPHEAPSRGILLLLSIFSGLTGVLSGVLCASLLSVSLARQVREIGVMKTLGATRRTLLRGYLLQLGLIATAALLLSLPPTLLLTALGTEMIAGLLNFDLADTAVPLWVRGSQIAAAYGLLLLTAAPVILQASQTSVRQALDAHGARQPERPVRLPGRMLTIAATNMLRVPRRLVLTVGLLSVSGALFISATSVASAWQALTDRVALERHYDVELHLSAPPSPAQLADLDGELWGRAPAALLGPGGLPWSRTYPDGGHGMLQVVGVPSESRLVTRTLQSGRWLTPGERGAVVVNQLAAARLGPEPLGATLSLSIEGVVGTWSVIGVIEEVAAPASVYLPRSELEALGVPSTVVRLVGEPPADLPVAAVVPVALLTSAMAEHVVVLIRVLVGLAVLMASVGGLALVSTMSNSVLERTRELAVLRSIGARPRAIRGLLLLESIGIGLLSLPLAVLLAVPTSAAIGWTVGTLSFALPLPLVLSGPGIAAWIGTVMLLSALSALVPAQAALRGTPREALGHV